MNDTVADWLATGVEVFVCAVIMSLLLNVLSATHTVNSSISDQQSVISEMQEYREHNQFDFKHVHQQDIIGAIYKGRGFPRVEVSSSLGNYVWSENSAPCDYTTVAISALIDGTVIYDASVIRGNNNEVVAYSFTPHVAGCGR